MLHLWEPRTSILHRPSPVTPALNTLVVTLKYVSTATLQMRTFRCVNIISPPKLLDVDTRLDQPSLNHSKFYEGEGRCYATTSPSPSKCHFCCHSTSSL